MGEILVGIEVEPALSALRLGSAVPGEAQRLIAAVGEADQVLLQGIHAEGVGDLKILQWPVRPVGAHQEFPVAPEEGGGNAGVGEGRVVKITEHGLSGGRLHGLGVLRTLPVPIFCSMAFGAALRADVAAVRWRDRRMAGRQRHGKGSIGSVAE